MAGASSDVGPHQAIELHAPAERFLAQLFDRLWARFRERVEHVAAYEQIIAAHGARFVNDHLAFRTFACQQPHVGVCSLARMFEALGYRAAGVYTFEDKLLQALHYQHPNSHLPKLFISELQVWRLGTAARQIVSRTLVQHRPALDLNVLAQLVRIEDVDERRWAELLETCRDWIETLPWQPPLKQDVLALNDESQYGAWVLAHGYNVNHFTSLINSHGVDSLADMERTVAALRAAGVPLKAEIEGQPGTLLRQTATTAAVIDIAVREQEHVTSMPWTYAYFELAERGLVTDPQSGMQRRFEGFLGNQAAQLFDLTRRD